MISLTKIIDVQDKILLLLEMVCMYGEGIYTKDSMKIRASLLTQERFRKISTIVRLGIQP
jgi:hypothetical protein